MIYVKLASLTRLLLRSYSISMSTAFTINLQPILENVDTVVEEAARDKHFLRINYVMQHMSSSWVVLDKGESGCCLEMLELPMQSGVGFFYRKLKSDVCLNEFQEAAYIMLLTFYIAWYLKNH